ncbi:MAG: QueT transporter family protein [Clostridiales bacterium]|nr:QueT transporter family protein [Clostridiales bacterium]
MRNRNVTFIVRAAAIAALYVVLTVFIAAFQLASGSIQVRISEALCILPYFTSAAIPGLWIGCFLANLITGATVFDVIFGSLATLIGAVGTYLLRKRKVLCTIPPVLSNAVIVPLILIYAYKIPAVMVSGVNVTFAFNFVTVGIGEVVSVCVLGGILLRVLEKYRNFLFKD